MKIVNFKLNIVSKKRNQKLIFSILVISLFFSTFLVSPVAVHAQPSDSRPFPELIPLPSGTCPAAATAGCHPDGPNDQQESDGYCYETVPSSSTDTQNVTYKKFTHSGVPIQCNYSVCDFLQLGVNFAQIILYLFLGVAFILLLWGATGFVMSRGNPEAVQQNMALLKGTIFGVVIILVAWQLVAIIISILSPGAYSETAKSPLYFFRNQDVRAQCLKQIKSK